MRITEPYTVFPRRLPSGRVVWYYQRRLDDGTRSAARSTGCGTRAKALRLCGRLYAEGRLGGAPALLFANYAADFFAPDGAYCRWKAVNGRPMKPSTIVRYNALIRRQLLPFFGGRRMDELTPALAREWVLWAAERWSAKSVNNAQGVLNIIVEDAIDKGHLDRNPLRRLGYRMVRKKSRVLLTPAEIGAVCGARWSREECRKAFMLAAITGMRVGEVLALRAENVKDGWLDVRHTWSRFGGLQATKTGLCRCVPIPAGAPLGATRPYLFSPDGSSPVSAAMVYKNFTTICAALGIDARGRGVTVHSLRASFVSYLQARNVTESKIRAVVGHAEETMTDLYTYWRPDMFPEVYEAQAALYREITDAQNKQGNRRER